MWREPRAVEVKESVATGTVQKCSDLIDKWLQLTGSGTFVVEPEGTFDGTVWYTITTFTGAGGKVEVPEPYSFIRFNTTGYTSGTLAGLLIGRDARTD